MKIPAWMLPVLLSAAMAAQGWLILAVIDLRTVQAAQGAKIDSLVASISAQQQLTKNESPYIK